MRHQYTNRLVVAMSVLLAGASVLFALGAVAGVGAGDRVGDILALDVDPAAGEALYVRDTDRPCADCHTLAAAGAESDRAVDLDDLEPSQRAVVASIVGGRIGAHEAQGYRWELSDRQIGELAAYVEQVAGSEP